MILRWFQSALRGGEITRGRNGRACVLGDDKEAGTMREREVQQQ